MKNVVIIGCGGIGSHLLSPLIRFLATLEVEKRPETIVMVDGDSYSESNVSRQEFVATRQMGDNKAEAQAQRYEALYPRANIEFGFCDEYVGENNVADIIQNDDVVFMCVDNHVCRNLVSKHCQTLNDIILISGGNELTDGNVQFYAKAGGSQISEPIESRHPEIASTKDGDRSTMSCEELEQLPSGGQIIITNLMAATLMLQMFWNLYNDRVDTKEVYFDVQLQKTRPVKNG